MALLSANGCEGPDYASTSQGYDFSGLKADGMIVVASESESIRGIVAWILEDAGHKCMQASDASQLVAAIESKPVVLAVVDAASPEFEMPPTISSTSSPRIILLLENGQVPRKSWKFSNVASLVIKPFSASQILSSVASALSTNRLIL